MTREYLLAGLMVVALIAPAAAATEYYVAKGQTTKKCQVVSKKPDGKTMVDVGMMAYKTKAEAEKALKASPDCKS
jgi:hypothetical protein